MDAIVYEISTGNIKYVVEDCTKKGKKLWGSNMFTTINEDLFGVGWVDSFIEGPDNINQVELSTESNEIIIPTKEEVVTAVQLRKAIDTMSYQELEDYIEANVTDLASAKVFIKLLSKVVLALCKIVDSK